MTALTMKTPTGADGDSVDCPTPVFGIEPNMAVLHQVVTAQLAAARARHAQHQDPRRGERRRRQAVAPEGHRPGSPGLDPLPALAGRRCCPRTEAPVVHAADAQQDDPARAWSAALSDRAAEDKVMVVDRWAFDAPKTKDAVARSSRSGCVPTVARAPRVLLVLDRHRRGGVEVVPQPRRPRADHPARGTQHVRRAGQRLAGVLVGDARCRVSRPATASARTEPRSDSGIEQRPRRDHAPGRVGEVLHGARHERLHVRGRHPARTRSRFSRRSRRSSA